MGPDSLWRSDVARVDISAETPQLRAVRAAAGVPTGDRGPAVGGCVRCGDRRGRGQTRQAAHQVRPLRAAGFDIVRLEDDEAAADKGLPVEAGHARALELRTKCLAFAH